MASNIKSHPWWKTGSSSSDVRVRRPCQATQESSCQCDSRWVIVHMAWIFFYNKLWNFIYEVVEIGSELSYNQYNRKKCLFHVPRMLLHATPFQALWHTERPVMTSKKTLDLLMEAGWKIESITEALGILAKSIEWWEENYTTHGCVKPHKSIKVSWLTADVIDNILQRIQPFYLTGPGNGSHCTMTNLSQLQLCTWTYRILPSHTKGPSKNDDAYRMKWIFNVTIYHRSAGVSWWVQQGWTRSTTA